MIGPSATHPLIERLERSLAGRTPRLAERDEPFREAAVALVLRPADAKDLELLFIRRSEREGDPWSGQVALPGGRYEPADGSLQVTAERETREEIGLDLTRHGRLLGALDEYRPRIAVLPPVIVRPYLAIVEEVPPLVCSDEVAATFWVPLRGLFDPANRGETSVTARGLRMRVDAIRWEREVIWGMTERILRDLEPLVR